VPGFLTDEQLGDAVAATLGKTRGQLYSESARWVAIVSDANADAYGALLNAAAHFGYTEEQLLSWSRGATWQRRIGRADAIENGDGLPQQEPEKVKTDYLGQAVAELANGLVFDGVLIRPARRRVLAGRNRAVVCGLARARREDPVRRDWDRRYAGAACEPDGLPSGTGAPPDDWVTWPDGQPLVWPHP
jgi:hypothetical protein